MFKFRPLAKLLKTSREILIFCHQNADPDAICSAFATQFLIKKLQRKAHVSIVVTEGMSRVAKKVVELISVDTVTEPAIESTDLIIIVDTNNLRQLGKWGGIVEKSGVPLVIVDHHAPHPKTTQIESYMIHDEDVSSTCEIIYDIFKNFKIRQTKRVANAILIGIVYETRHLSLASSKSLIKIAELIRDGGRVEDAILVLQIPMSNSERIARLKAAQRIVFIKAGDWLIASAEASSYQASVARVFITIGAHVAIVGGRNKERLSISLRCTKDFAEKTGIHLGRDIAIPIGELLNGAGGGHAMAAGINGTGDLEDGIGKCADRIKDMLS